MIRKHSISLHGHRTSFSLEDAFWQEIRGIAERRNIPIAALIADIDGKRPADCNLSSALRLYVLEWLKQSGSDPH
ncbi:aryl-sulfate sulfotransferase [Agrobacterium vitis]|uniref:Aryl-sulfate sulfotransferase n=1 Tax=Agrobacterium vitis TaxID=373 RepID=A0A368N704_AGRVI|nr:ribbon-helix-helix domain-containing protein [Agrobacterium vitis]KAA3512768.1 aryl-sulfate sulfotransferase [Agrobacterium vitis]KAA3526186.1 aryl-sulfate sulfotransferase [Agrobacterium vitis]MCF1478211.1 aryl-sulfate sulfotransferase [Agrobacterium vitis]MUZ99539.1 aryl-sulfate sulfotransferase [Agrobacterium vitis]MVA32266.1 aryl-sulfate sulfotransferase [Agrobacterium vitis]